MNLVEFIKKTDTLFKNIATVRIDLSMHGSRTTLEMGIEETPDYFGQNKSTSKKFIAIIDLDKRFGLVESNFENIPEQIRTAVFETVIEFVSTPTNKK